jgi:hypothetical protein
VRPRPPTPPPGAAAPAAPAAARATPPPAPSPHRHAPTPADRAPAAGQPHAQGRAVPGAAAGPAGGAGARPAGPLPALLPAGHGQVGGAQGYHAPHGPTSRRLAGRRQHAPRCAETLGRQAEGQELGAGAGAGGGGGGNVHATHQLLHQYLRGVTHALYTAVASQGWPPTSTAHPPPPCPGSTGCWTRARTASRRSWSTCSPPPRPSSSTWRGPWASSCQRCCATRRRCATTPPTTSAPSPPRRCAPPPPPGRRAAGPPASAAGPPLRLGACFGVATPARSRSTWALLLACGGVGGGGRGRQRGVVVAGAAPTSPGPGLSEHWT